MKKIVSSILIFSVLVIALSSCKRQTGGFNDPNQFNEYWWLESYDECVDGIERLMSHGSSFNNTALISDDSDLFDMKYCVLTNRLRADKEVGIFVNRFDRKVEGVIVMCFAFFDNVEIDELIYSNVWDYKAYQIIVDVDSAVKNDFYYEELTEDSLECTEVFEGRQVIYEYRFKDDEQVILSIKHSKFINEKLDFSVISEILNSIEADMFEKMKNNMQG